LKVFITFSLILLSSVLATMPLISASSSLTVNVQTSKPWYNTSESITVFGLVLSNGTPVSGVIVALEVHDTVGSPVISRSIQTNSSGIYAVVFMLPEGAMTGSYNVYVSCAYGGQNVFNSTTFEASALAVTIVTDKGSYDMGENVTVTGAAMLNGVALPQTLVAVEVQDPNATPIVVRVLETDSQGAYRIVFQVSTGSSSSGQYTAFASVNHEGSTATALTTFALKPAIRPADINGDGVVNILDLALVARAWSSTPSSPSWDPRCDLNKDDRVNIIDITLVAREYGR
jgi:uncharacterized protein YfaS (alpha-2-macroglobulin family)